MSFFNNESDARYNLKQNYHKFSSIRASDLSLLLTATRKQGSTVHYGVTMRRMMMMMMVLIMEQNLTAETALEIDELSVSLPSDQ